ncbi:MAG: hypothetical protein COA94_02165 [Rickettsiales bacterium]|nr:MAG: hypothetical protein COA94_02165 [Rickettsiales bacterium]
MEEHDALDQVKSDEYDYDSDETSTFDENDNAFSSSDVSEEEFQEYHPTTTKSESSRRLSLEAEEEEMLEGTDIDVKVEYVELELDDTLVETKEKEHRKWAPVIKTPHSNEKIKYIGLGESSSENKHSSVDVQETTKRGIKSPITKIKELPQNLISKNLGETDKHQNLRIDLASHIYNTNNISPETAMDISKCVISKVESGTIYSDGIERIIDKINKSMVL